MGAEGLGVYLHVPFCRRKCPYCDFFSVPAPEVPGWYPRALRAELRAPGGELTVSRALVESPEFEYLRALWERFAALGEPPFRLRQGAQEQEVASEEELVGRVLEAGRRGLEIQRYKGLGEMNPQQLWETTMNPQTRTLLQVTVEDALEADQIFTILMGEQVEPRREFIQSHALEVRNLDV